MAPGVYSWLQGFIHGSRCLFMAPGIYSWLQGFIHGSRDLFMAPLMSAGRAQPYGRGKRDNRRETDRREIDVE
jgi:hypothetical protein